MTATIHNIRDYASDRVFDGSRGLSPERVNYLREIAADVRSKWAGHLCEDYCGHTPCECYPDSISFAKSGEPKVPA